MSEEMISRILESLKIMGFGMGGIFFVVAIFYVTIVLLNKLLPAKEEKK